MTPTIGSTFWQKFWLGVRKDDCIFTVRIRVFLESESESPHGTYLSIQSIKICTHTFLMSIGALCMLFNVIIIILEIWLKIHGKWRSHYVKIWMSTCMYGRKCSYDFLYLQDMCIDFKWFHWNQQLL